jgi:hypothetical protein
LRAEIVLVGSLEPGISVMFAVRGVTGHLHDDGVFGHVLAVVCAERNPGDPGAEESAPRLELTPARQLSFREQALVLRSLLGTDIDDDDVQFTHNRSSSATSSAGPAASILDNCAARSRGGRTSDGRCGLLAVAGLRAQPLPATRHLKIIKCRRDVSGRLTFPERA